MPRLYASLYDRYQSISWLLWARSHRFPSHLLSYQVRVRGLCLPACVGRYYAAEYSCFGGRESGTVGPDRAVGGVSGGVSSKF